MLKLESRSRGNRPSRRPAPGLRPAKANRPTEASAKAGKGRAACRLQSQGIIRVVARGEGNRKADKAHAFPGAGKNAGNNNTLSPVQGTTQGIRTRVPWCREQRRELENFLVGAEVGPGSIVHSQGVFGLYRRRRRGLREILRLRAGLLQMRSWMAGTNARP